jgi:hypothetical protein
MGQIAFRANLANDDFPLLSDFKGQTVLMGRFDQDYELDSGKATQTLQKQKQIPQVYYCHNVVPTQQGYQSVGFTQKIAALGGAADFNEGYVLRDPVENKFLYSPAGGKNYVFDQNVGVWVSRNPIAAAGKLVTVAYLNGETYIFYEKVGCFRYDRGTTAMVAVVLTGLVVANINGICAAQGFLVAWDDANNVYRSQAASPLDFTPDPSLGSGAGIPQDIRGKIVVILPIAGGYIVYTTKNAVAGVFQQNIRYPFIYREVAGSAGITTPNNVSWNNNLGDHYAWTTAGLQKVDKSKAENVFPDVSDFLTAKKFEDYDIAIDSFTITNLGAMLDTHVAVVGSRYLVISYGVVAGTYTHALIYDIAEKRWGKLKITHTDCFDYAVPNLVGVVTFEDPKGVAGFLQSDGTVKIINFDLTTDTNSGVIVLGKYQFVRERWINIQEIELENIEQTYTFSLRVLCSYDGKNTALVVKDPVQLLNSGKIRRYGGYNIEGKNITLVGVGTFDLTSLQIRFIPSGAR